MSHPRQHADTDRLARQIDFAVEIDKLKQIVRQTYLMDRSRKENDAEHSWHFALLASLLAEYAAEDVDVLRVLRMALVHDLVEIDAGDVVVYDAAARAGQAELEQAAAERIFGLLPDDQGAELRTLWEEFEARATPEARFAKAIDRVQPILHNYATQGATWRDHGITKQMVLATNAHVADGSPALWAFVQRLLDDAAARGYLADPPEGEHA
ncbi:MAG: HD domain-containing protein [Planctomycetes bacterium]|jgi:putative hydrolase of HD superfamily|nr:HD domain-containing protein [Planctomycetota bacterium]